MRRVLTCLIAGLLLLTAACSSTTASGPLTIDVTVANGKVSPSGAKYDVVKGSTVTINVSSDANETVHVHGYEIEKDVTPGQKLVITFVANMTGSFDIETHVIDATIATLNVR
ncbi:MAG TPA: cupredoxin domain-containing protein [Dermatophilaceae bacterium]